MLIKNSPMAAFTVGLNSIINVMGMGCLYSLIMGSMKDSFIKIIWKVKGNCTIMKRNLRIKVCSNLIYSQVNLCIIASMVMGCFIITINKN